ncbi:MAG: phosphoribosylglycinamide formyltransferase [Candidatus Firestonebacteria bacterium]
MNKIKLAVLVSGRGSNLQSIIDACESNQIKAEVKVVISDKKDVHSLERAKKYNIKNFFIDPKVFSNKEEHEKAILKIIDEENTDLICLAGYMRLLTNYFVRKYKGRIINIHPSLLPSFPGACGPSDALQYGVKISGCTVHFVDEGEDTGPIILQSVVSVKDDDTIESLSARILTEEHKIFPEAINLFANKRLEIEGRRVKIVNKEKKGEKW